MLPHDKVKFAGDFLWDWMYKGDFNESYPYDSFHVQDIDPLDRESSKKLDLMLKESFIKIK
jgi:hypothetical protein